MRNTYELAQKRVKKKKEFYQHLTSYVSVGAFLLAINAATSFGSWWFLFPMLGWGIGLAIHYFSVFGIPLLGKYDEEWEAQTIRAEVERKEALFNVQLTKKEYSRIRKKVKEKAGFFHHFGAYIAVGFFFFAINALTSFGEWWFYIPMLGWGIGLVSHYMAVFGIGGFSQWSENWEERAIQQEMQKLERREVGTTSEEDQEPESGLDLPELEKNAEPRKKWDDSQLV